VFTTSSGWMSFTIAVDQPRWFWTSNVACVVGRRRSASSNTVLLPACAKAIATLAAVVDLPAPGVADVKSTDFISESMLEYVMFVLIVLYCSLTGDFGSLRTIRSRGSVLNFKCLCFLFAIYPSLLFIKFRHGTQYRQIQNLFHFFFRFDSLVEEFS